MRTLFEISRANAVVLDAGQIANISADHIRQLFQADVAGLWLWDAGRQALVRAATSRSPAVRFHADGLEVRAGMAWQAFTLGRPVLTRDYANYRHRIPSLAQSGITQGLAAPLLTGERPIGAVALGRAKRRPFTAQERRALQSFAEQLAPIAEAMQLRKEIDARGRESAALADLAREGVRERDLAKLLSLLTRHTAALLGADYAIANEIDDEANVRHRGSFGELGDVGLGPLSRGSIGRAALKAGKTLVLTQATARGRALLAHSPTHSLQGAWALLASPIPSSEGLRGVLHAGWRRPFRPGSEEIRLLETLAAFAGGMIDSVHGRELAERRHRASERRLALAAISEALDDASRDVQAMLDVTVRETSRVLGATCAIRLLSDDEQYVLGGAVFDDDASLLETLGKAMIRVDVSLADSLYRRVVRDGVPDRWFDGSGTARKKTLISPIRTVLGESPLYAALVAPIRRHRKVLGTIGLYQHAEPRPFTDQDERFLMDICERVGPVLENAQLFEELTANRARLQALSQRLIAAQDLERRAIALELHDEISQLLTGARLLIEAARRLPARLRDHRLEEAGRTLDDAIEQVRSLTLDLRPPLLDGFGLPPALTGYFDRYRARTGVQVDFEAGDLSCRPAADVEIAAYRIIQEGLTNIARHAGVDRAEVRLRVDSDQLRIFVADGGRGFETEALPKGSSTGLLGMQERAEALGGEVLVDSAPGQGTRLLVRLPLLSGAPAR